ncbi:golgin subfamily A member 6-like protein 6 [Drosophila serrata]|uniref:golgin subfamily A member 6-like protein 6 n=1 Tax=Drosophila serrata TaxID=7274 RepID=UPI000A1CFD33|nr:golgin subfamily A member 6-like protein 6 [Drosophila serrata]
MSMTEMMRGKAMSPEKMQNIKLAQHEFSNVRLVQIGCVMGVLAEAIERVKISLILPKLLEHPAHMAKVLQGTKYEPAVRLVSSFLRRRVFILREKRPPLADHGMIQIIDFFQRNNEMHALFPRYYNHLSNEESMLLKAFHMLYELAKDRLYRTSTEAMAQERQLYAMYKENEKVKVQVAELREKIRLQKLDLKQRVEAKEAHLQTCEEMLEKKMREKNQRIQKEIDRINRMVRAKRKVSLERQAELEEKLEATKNRYETSTRAYLKREEALREEKNKLVLQVQALIKKYDHVIGDKMIEKIEIGEQHKAAKKKLDDFMVGFRRVERVYKEVVVKREEEENRRRQQRIIVFAMNRAASKIQKYWRKWKRHMRRKNRKLKNTI